MKISFDSWHYKLNLFTPSNSLCVYFWQVILSVICHSFFAIVTAWSAFLVLLSGIGAVAFLLGPFIGFYDILEKCGIYAVGIVAIGMVVGFSLIGGLINYLSDNIDFAPNYLKFSKESDTEDKDNLFLSYLKSKKEKICPIIEFTDD